MVKENPYAGRDYPDQLTLEWLAEQNLPVYVRNITRPRGQLAINFPVGNGRTQVIKLLRTHLPIRLSDKLSYTTILESNDLRICWDKGVVDYVRPDVAWEELQDPGASEQIKRLRLSQFSAKNAMVSTRVSDMEKTIDGKVDADTLQLEPMGIDTKDLNPRVLRFVEQLRSGDLPIKAALSELKTMEDEIRDTDCSYIIANGPEGQVRNYVQKILAQRQGTQIDENSVVDDGEADLTDEEKAEEASREAQARQHQRV